MKLNLDIINNEVIYKTSKSGGPGGQNVNKVETKVTLLWPLMESKALSIEQKNVVFNKLKSRVQSDGLLQLVSAETRSQLENKKIVFLKLVSLVEDALKPIKSRKPTKIPYSKVLKRLDQKSKQAEKKSNRRWKLD